MGNIILRVSNLSIIQVNEQERPENKRKKLFISYLR
jgi:hypothetical protein